MNARLLTGILLMSFFVGCQYENLDYTDSLSKELQYRLESVAGDAQHFRLPDHQDLSSIPQDERNPLTADKVKLGQFLFFETGIGIDASQGVGMETYSCATCHDPKVAFKPAARQGIADGGFGYGELGEMRVKNPSYGDTEIDAQGARPLSVLNVAFVENTFWNGQFGSTGANEGTEHLWNREDGSHVNALGFEAMEGQNHEGLIVHRQNMNRELAEELGYRELFDKSFPEVPEEERYSQHTMALALSAYLRSLITDQAPFQKWLRGDETAMTDEQIKGALLFFGKARCFVCHNEPNLGSKDFFALGVYDMFQMNGLNTGADDLRNLGRGGFTKRDEDMFAFKAPQLYNMKENPFFFHGGSVFGLENLLEYKINARPENPNVPAEYISEKFRPLDLTDEEKNHLLAFLRDGLYDAEIERYVPDFIMSGNCFPNNDPRSKSEIGCD
jgi:cytochrome c peroxidase